MVPLHLLSGLDTRTKFIATTLGVMTCCVLLLQKLLRTSTVYSKASLETLDSPANYSTKYNTPQGNIRQTETLSDFKIKLKRYLRQ